MRRVFILFFVVVLPFKIFGQVHHTYHELDKFVGTWRWVSGNDTVEIVLQKQVIYYDAATPSNIESLVGWHRYVKNGVLKENSMQFIGSSYNTGSAANNVKSTLLGGVQKPTNLYMNFSDLTLNKNEELWFTLLPASLTQATWKLREPRGLYMGSAGTAGKVTLPKDLKLIKQ